MTARQRAMTILPICLLLLNAVQEVIAYKLPKFIRNPYTRTAVLIFLFAVGFAIIGDFLVPWIATLFEHGHKKSQKEGGKSGILIFYILSFAGIYLIYYIIYIKGPQYILPPLWR